MASLLLVFVCIQLFLDRFPLSSLVYAIDSQHRVVHLVQPFFEFFQTAGQVYQIPLLLGINLFILFSFIFVFIITRL